MQLIDFKADAPGKVIRTPQNYSAFVPNSLPPSLHLGEDLIHELSIADRALGELNGVTRNLLNPHLLIGPPGCTLMDATYVPPPVEEMNASLDGFEKYLHAPSSLPPLLRLALIHYQFEAIHPFLDGNGRIGRLLISLLLCKEGLLDKPFLYLSAYFERTRRDYYRHLLAISQQNEWEEWLLYFVHGVAEQSSDGVKRTHTLLNLWKRYKEKAQATRGSAKLLAIVDDLFRFPALSAPRLMKQFKVTARTAQASIDKLVSLGILTEATGKLRNRIYVAQEILRVLDEKD
jgi:Fic family protein